MSLSEQDLKIKVVNLHDENVNESTFNKSKIQEISEKLIPDEEALNELLTESTKNPTNCLSSDISENKLSILFQQENDFKKKSQYKHPIRAK